MDQLYNAFKRLFCLWKLSKMQNLKQVIRHPLAFARGFFIPFSLSESVILSAAAVLIGLASGAGIWGLKKLIALSEWFFFTELAHRFSPLGNWQVVILPVIGGLVVGLILHFGIGKERYHGVAGIIEACALGGGKLPYLKMPIRVLAAALSIGSGASVGPEDPSVQVGANIGSAVGQWLHLSEERLRSMTASGVAAGVAAAFNAPIAGVFFALEVLLGELNGSAFGFAAVAAVTSSIFIQATLGKQPAFLIPEYAFHSLWELPLYLLLGLFAGLLAAGYVHLIAFTRRQFHRMIIPTWLKPATAGLLVGLVGMRLPQIFGVGYTTIENVLSGVNYAAPLLLILLLTKLLMTSISIGGGFAGGVFAPALFLGAVLGGAFGTTADVWFPGVVSAAPSFALVGMAAVLAGAVQAPLTAILLLFEMTQDYHIILPLMFAVAVSLAVSRKIGKESVYSLPLVQNGIRLEHGRDVEVLQRISVGEVMTAELTSLHSDDSLQQAMLTFQKTGHHGLPVMDAHNRLVGMLSLQDLHSASPMDQSDCSQKKVADFCTPQLVTAFPDETLAVALRRMSSRDIGRLPVVSRADHTRLLGMLRRGDIIRAYEMALIRQADARHRLGQHRLEYLSGAKVTQMEIQANSNCIGKRICEVAWHPASLIASVQRGSEIILPHGDQVLQAGDILAVVTSDEAALQDVQNLCAPHMPEKQ